MHIHLHIHILTTCKLCMGICKMACVVAIIRTGDRRAASCHSLLLVQSPAAADNLGTNSQKSVP